MSLRLTVFLRKIIYYNPLLGSNIQVERFESSCKILSDYFERSINMRTVDFW